MATQLTQEALDRLQEELSDLTIRGRVEIAKRIEEARALGDLSENGDYHAAKDEQGKMESRIRQLQAMLEDVQVVEAGGPSDGTVRVGSTVEIDFLDGYVDRFYVGNIEERPEGLDVLSPDSPLGQALIGRSAGDEVTYKVADKAETVKLVEVA